MGHDDLLSGVSSRMRIKYIRDADRIRIEKWKNNAIYLQSEEARTMVIFALRSIPSLLRRLSKTISSVFASRPLKQSSITSNSLRAKAARAIDFQASS